MQRASFAFVIALGAALTGVTPERARAQDSLAVARAEWTRGPRFLFTTEATPVRVDASRVPALVRRLSLHLAGVTLEEALTHIASKADLKLFYSRSVVPLATRVSLSAIDITVAAALTEVLFDANVDILFSTNGQAALVRRVEADAPPQAVDVIRGTVRADSATPIPRATVTVTRGPDRAVQTVVTDSLGRYRVVFSPGTGDYLVAVSAEQFRTARRRVQREASEREMVADYRLAKDVTTLAALRVRAAAPTRPTAFATSGTPEVGGSEQWTSTGMAGRISPTDAGSIDALYALVPGVQITSGGPSILGSGPSSNLVTLNGMGFAGGALPRAARTESRVTGATFDPTRGGFSGANLDLRLGAGSRTAQLRRAFLTFTPRTFEVLDQPAQQLGGSQLALQGSLGAEGELIAERLTYNVAVDVAQRRSAPATLFQSSPDALSVVGVAASLRDGVLRQATSLGIPIKTAAADTRVLQQQSAIGRLDWTSDPWRQRSLLLMVSSSRDPWPSASALRASTTALPSSDRLFQGQLTWGGLYGPQHLFSSSTRLAFARQDQQRAAALEGPRILLTAPSALSGGNDVATIALGGAGAGASGTRAWMLEGANTSAWNRTGSRHRFKSLVQWRLDGLSQTSPGDAGTVSFPSLGAFEQNAPASFARTIGLPVRDAWTWNLATALAHQWEPRPLDRSASLPSSLTVLYGVRLEASGLGDAPVLNTTLQNALSVSTNTASRSVHVLPRVGFTYTYSKRRGNFGGNASSDFGTFALPTMGYIRGGVGLFRDLLRPDEASQARAFTGLGATQTLSCVGAAVPAIDWRAAFDAGRSLDQCANGAPTFAERTPVVTALAPHYDAARTWRGTLGWTSLVRKWTVSVDGLAGWSPNQLGLLDRNFAGQLQFVLPTERGRPVYVPVTAIESRSGALTQTGARVAPAFGAVWLQQTDLAARGGQLTVTAAPNMLVKQRLPWWYGSVSYTLQRLERQQRGFDGATDGDPRERRWTASPTDARHLVMLQGALRSRRLGQLFVFSRLQSGTPFSALVSGDINGDGLANDLALVPAAENGDTVARSMGTLLTSASPAIRRCLTESAGQIAALNGCRTGWSAQLGAQWRLPNLTLTGRQFAPTLAFQNPLSGLDALLHGRNHTRGWGSLGAVDPSLLVPVGFDATSRAFRYVVNPRFGNSPRTRATTANPFRVSLDVSMDLSTPFPLQQLRRAVEPRRVNGVRVARTADSVLASYLRTTTSLQRVMLFFSDSLFLSNAQIQSLIQQDSAFSIAARALYRPLSETLSSLSARDIGQAAIDSAKATDLQYRALWFAEVAKIEEVLSVQQFGLMGWLRDLRDAPPDVRRSTNYSFGPGFDVPLLYRRPRIGGG